MNSLIVVALCIFGGVFGMSQHPGAYSSPHYAKKNSYSRPYDQPSPYSVPEYQVSKHQELELPQPQPEDADRYQKLDAEVYEGGNGTQSGRSSGIMTSVGNFLKGRGGQMLADIAREVIARSTGATSQVGGECIAQVLSLNLTNLVILVVLKALILAAGMFGSGAWHHNYARSLNDDNSIWIEEKELELWMSYLEGGDYACLTNAACRMPKMAKKYTSGADLLLTGSKMLSGIIPYDRTYEKIVEEVKEAAKWGESGLDCEVKYKKC